MKEHQNSGPEEYRHIHIIEVSSDFADTHEIEYSMPESFLYQSGYLTIEKSEGDKLTLGYPNEELRKSLVRIYLEEIYHKRARRLLHLQAGDELHLLKLSVRIYVAARA